MNGSASVPGIRAGVYRIVVSKNGYGAYSSAIDIHDTQSISITLSENGGKVKAVAINLFYSHYTTMGYQDNR